MVYINCVVWCRFHAIGGKYLAVSRQTIREFLALIHSQYGHAGVLATLFAEKRF